MAVCCNCRRRRGARLPRRRHERSGAAAVMTAWLVQALCRFWNFVTPRRSRPPNQLSLGGLFGDRSRRSRFDVFGPQNSDLAVPELEQRQNPKGIRKLAGAENAAPLPRRVSSALAGSGRA